MLYGLVVLESYKSISIDSNIPVVIFKIPNDLFVFSSKRINNSSLLIYLIPDIF